MRSVGFVGKHDYFTTLRQFCKEKNRQAGGAVPLPVLFNGKNQSTTVVTALTVFAMVLKTL